MFRSTIRVEQAYTLVVDRTPPYHVVWKTQRVKSGGGKKKRRSVVYIHGFVTSPEDLPGLLEASGKCARGDTVSSLEGESTLTKDWKFMQKRLMELSQLALESPFTLGCKLAVGAHLSN